MSWGHNDMAPCQRQLYHFWNLGKTWQKVWRGFWKSPQYFLPLFFRAKHKANPMSSALPPPPTAMPLRFLPSEKRICNSYHHNMATAILTLADSLDAHIPGSRKRIADLEAIHCTMLVFSASRCIQRTFMVACCLGRRRQRPVSALRLVDLLTMMLERCWCSQDRKTDDGV
jgi:hypothetical protein